MNASTAAMKYRMSPRKKCPQVQKVLETATAKVMHTYDAKMKKNYFTRKLFTDLKLSA